MKKSQVWIETVIYTLIGLAIIGMLLAIIKPQIEKEKDKLIIEQSLNMLNKIDSEIQEIINYGAGNSRAIEVQIKKGKLIIDSNENSVKFNMKSKYQYSQIGDEIEVGNVIVKTEKSGSDYDVLLKLSYSYVDITYKKEDEIKTYNPASTPHKIKITNQGEVGEMVNVDFG
ncbi:MAG: hypothetical protein KJ559_03405 [Nanoarchaeota archaeon]|nr:hypothetical protein [Nanoarchaeota archaeon]